jgi:vesicle coat complex subunit
MTSIIRVGQSKFVTVPIDEDSHERILNCIQTLSELEEKPAVHEIFLQDTKAAYSKMLGAQEAKAAERKDAESTKAVIVQVDDLLTFRQFSKKSADDAIDVCDTTSGGSVMKVLTAIIRSTTRTLEGLLAALKSAKTLYPILVVFRSSLVCIVGFTSLVSRSDRSSQVSPIRSMLRLMSRCTDSTSC